ncbi:YceI family protein [Nocardia sp. NPDC050175]|uniref:YceI family protein n=1 Tax=Nocardia sp. NPDC050175 TaxID=3364317 RepID=UPI00379FB938
MESGKSSGTVRSVLRRPIVWIIAALVVVALGVAGPFAYLRMVSSNNPKELSFSDLASSTGGPPKATTMPAELTSAAALEMPTVPTPLSSEPQPVLGAPTASPPPGPSVASPVSVTGEPLPPSSPIAGSWTVGSGTDARWATDDTLLGQTTRVVGRTNDVSGTIQIDGLAITSGRIVVNMQTAVCNCMHDSAYNEMLETAKFPTATFVLTSPIVFPSVPASGSVSSVPAAGQFTIHGVTRDVSFTFETTQVGARLAFKAEIPVEPADYSIQPPISNNPLASIGNTAIELLIAFDRS